MTAPSSLLALPSRPRARTDRLWPVIASSVISPADGLVPVLMSMVLMVRKPAPPSVVLPATVTLPPSVVRFAASVSTPPLSMLMSPLVTMLAFTATVEAVTSARLAALAGVSAAETVMAPAVLLPITSRPAVISRARRRTARACRPCCRASSRDRSAAPRCTAAASPWRCRHRPSPPAGRSCRPSAHAGEPDDRAADEQRLVGAAGTQRHRRCSGIDREADAEVARDGCERDRAVVGVNAADAEGGADRLMSRASRSV